MRKRSASETIEKYSPPITSGQSPISSKLHSLNITEREISPRNLKLSEGQYTQISEDKLLPTDVSGSSRVLRKDSNPIVFKEVKRKDPLPDITSDWQIIINSLKTSKKIEETKLEPKQENKSIGLEFKKTKSTVISKKNKTIKTCIKSNIKKKPNTTKKIKETVIVAHKNQVPQSPKGKASHSQNKISQSPSQKVHQSTVNKANKAPRKKIIIKSKPLSAKRKIRNTVFASNRLRLKKGKLLVTKRKIKSVFVNNHFKNIKSVSIKPRNKRHIGVRKRESSFHEVTAWKRPTRSTYKAFEDEIDPEMLGIQNVNGNVVLNEENGGCIRRKTRNGSITDTSKKVSSCSGKQPTIESNMISFNFASKNENEKKDQTLKNNNGNEDEKNNSKLISQCRVNLVKLENPRNEETELDFIGFDSSSPYKSPFANILLELNEKNNVSNFPQNHLTEKDGDKVESSECELNISTSILSEIIKNDKGKNMDDQKEVTESTTPIEISPKQLKENSPGVIKDIICPVVPPKFIPKLSTKDIWDRYFNMEEDNLVEFDFEGFTVEKYFCRLCSLSYPDKASLYHHRMYSHNKIYICPFDSGQCGKFKGSIHLHTHLAKVHCKLVELFKSYIVQDVESQLIADFVRKEENCEVCFIPMCQPHLMVHEMIVHAIQPSSYLPLSLFLLDEIVNIFWTGKMVAFNCTLCKKIVDENSSSQHFLCSPNSFVSVLAGHLQHFHKIKVSYSHIWWMLYKLLISLPPKTRRTMSSLISLQSETFGHCLVCGLKYETSANLKLYKSNGLCLPCTAKCGSSTICWVDCPISFKDASYLQIHLISHHPEKHVNGWCINCGLFYHDLVSHAGVCDIPTDSCCFCKQQKSWTYKLTDVYHSLSIHSYLCPFSNCDNTNFDRCEQSDFVTHTVLYSVPEVFEHIVNKHLLDFCFVDSAYLPNLLETILHKDKLFCGMLTNLNSLNGYWFGNNKRQYRLVRNDLILKATSTVPLTCSLCKSQWDCEIDSEYSKFQTVCLECSMHLKQYCGGQILPICPILTCTKELFPTQSGVVNHLNQSHKLATNDSSRCVLCQRTFTTRLSLVLHIKMQHEMPCPICLIVYDSAMGLKSHLCSIHFIKDWTDLCISERKERIINPESTVLKVWSKQGVIQVQVDPTVKINPNKNNEIEMFPKKIEMEPLKHNTHSESYEWCSSMCKVSMTPTKLITKSADVDLTAEISDDGEGNRFSSDLSSIHLLTPSVSISEEISQPSPIFYPERENIGSNFNDENVVLQDFITNGDQANKSSSNSPTFIGFEPNTTGLGFADVRLDSSNVENVPILKAPSKVKKSDKSLGDNACINTEVMALNIIRDLDDRFQSSCIDCSHSISLFNLLSHAVQFHSCPSFKCQCGYFGNLNDYLVHAFHMSHQPCEARPIMIAHQECKEIQGLIVLEERRDAKNKTFPCYKCGKRFKQEKSRQLHYNLCKLQKKLVCDLCGERFALQNHLNKHKEWKHNHQVCSYCNKEFSSSISLNQHIFHIHGRQMNYRCDTCKKLFNKSRQLKVHKRLHTNERPHSCTTCTCSFISKNVLIKHIRKKHYNHSGATDIADLTKDEDVTETDLDTSSSDSDSEPVKSIYSKKIVKHSNLKKSSTSVENNSLVQSDVPDRKSIPVIRDELIPKLSIIGEKCNHCDEDFQSIAGNLLHMYLIHPASVINQTSVSECGFCTYTFSSPDDLNDHHIDKHQRARTSIEDFECLCGLRFREDGAYYFHLYYAHKAIKALNIKGEIICRVCPGRPRLNKIVDLVVHLSYRHTMFDHVRFNDSYMCNFCLKAFESWTVLSLHFFMVHKATKSQSLSYDCPFCEGASPWHSLEALQYHLDNVHRGRHKESQPIPEYPDNIYTLAPGSPNKRKLPFFNIGNNNQKMKALKPAGHNEKQTGVLYCICQCPYDETSDMIGCDNVDCKYQWFHFHCVGIVSAPEGSWICQYCSELKRRELENIANNSFYDDKEPNNFAVNSSLDTNSSSSTTSSSSSDSSSSSSSSENEADV